MKHLGLMLMAYIFLVPTYVFSQGLLRGTVRDSLDNTLLIGANVYFAGTGIGAATDRDGLFRIPRIPAGTYTVRVSYLGYETKEFELKVGADEITMNIALLAAVVESEEVVVTAQVRGQIAAINQQIASNTIVNVISEEKIKELPDANAAEAIGRLTGVSILRAGGEANKVVLRGLESKFVNITVDGVKIPATEATDRGVDLSMLSQSSLAGVELFKALTPDKDGDAIAGTISLVTKKAPRTRQLRLDLKGDYNRLMNSYNQYVTSGYYGERFLEGFLGVQVSGNLEKRIRSNERTNVDYGDQDRTPIDAYFINNFLLEFTDEIRRREGGSVLLDLETPDHGWIKLNSVYGRTKRDYLWSIRDYPGSGGGSQDGFPVFDYRDREQDIKTFNTSLRGNNNLFGFSLSWGLSFAQSASSFPYDYEMIFAENPGMAPVPKFKEHPEQMIDYAYNVFQNAGLRWAYFRTQNNYDKERTATLDIARPYLLGDLFTGELKVGGKFKLKDRSNVRKETYTPYYLGRWYTHERAPDGTIREKNFSGSYFEEWRKLGGSVISLYWFLFDKPTTRDVYGSYSLNPLIMRDKLRQWRELNRYGVDDTGNQEEIWDNPLIRYDDHYVKERVLASYVMNTFNVGQWLTLIAGARIENEFNDYASTYMPRRVGGFPVEANSTRDTTSSYHQSMLLPNVQMSIRPFRFMNLRLAAYKAIGRPDYNMRLNRYIAGRPSESGTQQLVYVGNVSLRNAQAWNFEINPAFFDDSFGLVSFSVFYKEIKDMYHTLHNFNATGDSVLQRFGITWASQQTGPYNLTLPYNSPRPTKVWGFEFEHQINFHFLPGLLKNIVLSYNASLVRSETVLYGSETIITPRPPLPPLSRVILVERKQKLEGMPEFFGNIVLGYDLGGFSGRVSVYHQRKHNYSFSATGHNDVVKNGFTRLDVALRQRVFEQVVLFWNINNLTNIEDGFAIENRVFGRTLFDRSERYGLTSDFGVALEF
jgi:TonB-dependent receptor